MPLVPRTADLSTVGRHEIVAPAQVVASLFVSAATRGASYFVQLGNAEPSGPYSGKNLTVDLRVGVPLRERSEGVYIVNTVAIVGGAIVVQVGFSA